MDDTEEVEGEGVAGIAAIPYAWIYLKLRARESNKKG